jgi:hypothetical protein
MGSPFGEFKAKGAQSEDKRIEKDLLHEWIRKTQFPHKITGTWDSYMNRISSVSQKKENLISWMFSKDLF